MLNFELNDAGDISNFSANLASLPNFSFILPHSINSAWNKFLKRNNIRKIRIHDIRHTHATLLLAQGVDIKTISERLGHSNISITMNIYTDVLKELDKSAADKLDEI